MVMGPGIVIPHFAGYVSRPLMRLRVVPALSLRPDLHSKPVCMMIFLACDPMGIISLFVRYLFVFVATICQMSDN